MKRLILTVYVTVFLGCFFGKAQVTRSNLNVVPNNPITSPTNISQLEVSGRLITQNAFVGLGNPPAGQQTGEFGTAAYWNSMGNLNIPGATQVLNGFRTQTNGKGLAWGHSIPNTGQPNAGIVSNSFIEIIGNNTIPAIPSTDPNVTEPSGNLDFNFAQSPTGAAGVRKTALTIQPVTNVFGTPQFDAYTYARANCLIGQLQSGTYGGFNTSDKWVGIGNVTTSISSYIGTRVQSNSANLITGVESTTPFIQFNTAGNNTLPNGLKFRGDNGSTINEVMSMDVQGRIDMGAFVNTSSFTLAPFNYNLFVSGKNVAASNTVLNDQIGVGVYARPSSPASLQTTYRQYAVYGEANGGNQNGSAIGIYGNVINEGANDYSGNFNGKVVASAFITASDKRLKKGIKEEVSAIEKIMQLKPVSYTYDKTVSKWMNLEYNKTSHGFIADEVLAVFPEMVNEFNEPVMGNAKELEAARKFKAVNYIQLISVLTKGMQEQQAEITALKNEIAASKTMVLNNKTSLPTEIENRAFSLSQNVPNPFSEKTTISYTIPLNVNKAVLAVFDLNGRMLQQYTLLQGKNQLTINGNSFPAGMYIYSLIADGQEVVSKRMILTK